MRRMRGSALAWLVTALILGGCGGPPRIGESRQATGVKVGEVTSSSALVWTRVTRHESRRADGLLLQGRAEKKASPEYNPEDLQGSAPGAPGRVRVRYSTDPGLSSPRETEWVNVDEDTEFTHTFALANLDAATEYFYEVETAEPDGSVLHQPLAGRFETAPAMQDYGDVTFTVITGQAFRDADSPDGFLVYDAMRALNPKFLVATGDTVYYDSDLPLVNSERLAHFHWNRAYSLPSLRRFHLQVPAYWEKDDHDSYHDDNWPGMYRDYMGTFTWEAGLRVFGLQTPASEKPYRTFRWGKGLQIWLTEGRDYRSPNTMPDGPKKTIWGQEQKDWLFRTVRQSDADWKVIVSPTPIVGPDRGNKNDNHANAGFTHEGDEIRRWISRYGTDRLFVACGDRHWQYHSVDPATGVQEFSSGPVSDQHASGSPGEDPNYHRFHQMSGGFLSVQTRKEGDQSKITFRFHAVDGTVRYQYTLSQPAAADSDASPGGA